MKNSGEVILITGKKNSGKTHYAKALMKELEDEGYKVKQFDGDTFRSKTNNHDFSDEGRVRNLMNAAKLAADYEKKRYVVLLSFVSPRMKWRYKMRSLWRTSRLVYMPGGTLWEGTTYERPDNNEIERTWKNNIWSISK